MGVVADKLKELREREAKTLEMGGPEAVAQQLGRGKMTARERLNYFFDPGSFREIDMFVKHRGTLFGIDKMDIPAEGVITGFGDVNGRQVFAYAQDFTARAGSLGEMHAKKICKVMDLSLRAGKPIVGFCDSGGAR
ncbi:MAG TPA: carboxyl transferase domain-containing protein, partial [Syntrophobacteraceae bacterium]|nr:carboxyl transferase domain-containing protein [Syntrophobacteraceae bacterium]